MRASLKRIVSHPELSGAALKAFTDYPTLEEITVQFLHFVPPWIVVGSESLAEKTIRNALIAYEKSKGGRGVQLDSGGTSKPLLNRQRFFPVCACR